MANLSTQQAAEATGRSRSTIWRDIKKGRLSAQRSDGGDFLVDVAELERVYGALKPPETSRDDAVQPAGSSSETSLLQVQVALLRERVASLEADKHDLRDERDRLLHLLEQQAEHVRLLTDQREHKRRWWQRWRRET